MAALPYMPLYVADYMADAAHLSTLEHGVYLLLIMTYWQRGEALPADDRKLARICRMTDDEWSDVRETMAEFFVERDGTWRHKRVEQELDNVRAKSERARNAGRASAQHRFNDRSTSAQRASNHTDTDTDTDNNPPCVPPKASRLPKDWQPSPSDVAFAEDRGLSPDAIAEEADKFRDYWHAKSGKDATKRDWPGTWRNWIRRATERSPPKLSAEERARRVLEDTDAT